MKMIATSVRLGAVALFGLSFSGCATQGAVSQTQRCDLSSVEGVYALQEWHTNSGVLAPPAVDGRFVLQDGAVITILQNHADEANKITSTVFGVFAQEGCNFSYRYTNASLLIETGTGSSVSHKLPWEGMRVFAVTSEGAGNILRTADGKAELNFTEGGLRYSENGKFVRLWKKIAKR